MSDQLSEKRRLFVEAFMGVAQGNATEAARIAGYKAPNPVGSQLLAIPSVKAAIEERRLDCPLIASRQERQQVLSGFLRDVELGTGHRLKAIELLGRMQGDFLDRTEVTIKQDPKGELAGFLDRLHDQLEQGPSN